METSAPQHGQDPEILAIGIVYDALKDLEPEARVRVLEFVAKKLRTPYPDYEGRAPITERDDHPQAPSLPPPAVGAQESEDSEGVSPVAVKWMRRSGLTSTGLSMLFSLGVDEIDLVAKKVPGDNKKDRMHSVLLLKGIAAYLSSGVARFTHQQLKEACLHYDAYDGNNFASYLKDFAGEVSGTKSGGYTLTPRGLTAATEMIK